MHIKTHLQKGTQQRTGRKHGMAREPVDKGLQPVPSALQEGRRVAVAQQVIEAVLVWERRDDATGMHVAQGD